jgi:two-component system nitrate/nitrite response regulator NarL
VKRGVPTVIIESRTLLREGLASLLQDSNFKVIASSATLEAIDLSRLGPPGLLIVGIASGTDGGDLRVLERLSSARQDYTIVAVADGNGQLAPTDIPRILRCGADGYIVNVQSRDVLLKSLELALLEQKLVVVGDQVRKCDTPARTAEPDAPGIPPVRFNGNRDAHSALSEREVEILKCLACGDSNKAIARTCRIAESTVKIHLKSILRKIRVQNRTQAAIWAIQHLSRPQPPVPLVPSKSDPISFDVSRPPECD